MLHDMTSPGTLHVPLSLDDSPLATVCTVAPNGTLSSTHRLDDVFSTMKTFGINDGEGTIMFDFEPASDLLSCPTGYVQKYTNTQIHKHKYTNFVCP